MKQLQDLIGISRYYGNQKDYTLAGGGNTSWKNDDYIWVKASGVSLADISEDGFVKLIRDKVKLTGTKEYSNDPHTREMQVKEDLQASIADPSDKKRPSVETSLHELLEYPFVVHLHPTVTNSLTCSVNAGKIARELFGEKVMFTGFAAGYQLFKNIQSEIKTYRKKFNSDPHIILMQNHGIFVSAGSTEEIRKLYEYITEKIKSKLHSFQKPQDIPVNEKIKNILPALRMIVSEKKVKLLKIRNNSLIQHFCNSPESFAKASLPFTPDIIVYCKSRYLYIQDSSSPESIINEAVKKVSDFRNQYGYLPHIIMIKNYGLVAVGDNAMAAETSMDVYEDLLQISYWSESFGGPHFMEDNEINFIENWEVENYRRKIAQGENSKAITDQKVVIVTGGAQGFGEGIAEAFFKDNANVIIADLNEKKGNETADRLKKTALRNQIYYIKTDVSNDESVSNLVVQTVKNFGGIDVLISNAGILKAGGLDEMDAGTFDLMTRINYSGYFLTAKYVSEVMKIQSEWRKDYYADIIQINSKSGLRGSNKNFTYSGGKFGGIGLTQSFALELASYLIKVNAICPGNFFEGPLWSDPDKGLFVQYLKAGKIKGAKSIDDVRQHYEQQVPLGRGCRTEDVMKAIYYVIAQEYETGQAIPVTGGQVMLG